MTPSILSLVRIKLRLRSLIFLAALLPAMIGGSASTAHADTNLVWGDEFTATQIDLTKWKFDIGNNNGWGNNELQYYTSNSANAYVTNGFLHIHAQQQITTNITVSQGKPTTNVYFYTSARMKTQGLFWKKYGRIEWRAKLPAGAGFWPALWSLGTNFTSIGWPGCGEIDVMENSGANPFFVQGSIHSGSDATGIFNFSGGDSITNFHVYDLDWTTNSITWSVDGVAYENQTSWTSSTGKPYPFPFNQPFYFLMNLAVGGDYIGNPSTNSINPNLPGEMVIDYMRVYDDVPILQPGIVSVSPSNGCLSGGTLITISGSNFVIGATVTIGGLAASGVTVLGSNTVTALTPASQTASAKLVSLVNPGGHAATLSRGFTYLPGTTFGGLTSVTSGNGGATLSWSAASGGTPPLTYNVFAATASGGEDFGSPLLTTNGLSVFIAPLDPGANCTNMYFFVVRVTDGCNSSDGNVVELPVQPLTTPPTFSGLASVTPDINTATLSWSAASGGTPPLIYNVFEATASGTENFTSPIMTTNDLSISVPLYPGSNSPMTYFFVVRAQGGCATESNLIEHSVQPLLDPNGDQTGNGIPNWWDTQYGFNPFDPAQAVADADGDGVANLQEFLAGTDPTNSASSFHIISITPQGSDIFITWTCGGGRTNVVQAASDAVGRTYSNISDNIILSGTGDCVTNHLDADTATNAPVLFYRIQLVP